jgi:hypothetical protein
VARLRGRQNKPSLRKLTPVSQPPGCEARSVEATASTAEAPIAPPATSVSARTLVATLLAVAALTGGASFVYEIVWIRMLSLVLGASTHAFELMLAAFILGLASGGGWIRHRIDRIRDARAFLGQVQVWMGLAAALTLQLYGATFDAFAFLMAGLARTDADTRNTLRAPITLAVILPQPSCRRRCRSSPIDCCGRRGRAGHRQRLAANTLGAISA